MATKISFGELLNATIKTDNENDAKRKYNIVADATMLQANIRNCFADVTIKNKAVTDIRLGQVRDNATSEQIAYFTANANGFLDIGFNNTKLLTSDEQSSILAAVNAFIAEVIASVTQVTTESVLG